MKKIKVFNISVVMFVLLGVQLSSQAQLKDVVWSNPMRHPCYKGLTLSVLNMGWSDDVKAYLWGVRIKNNYTTTVSFRYLLSVGNEKKNAAKSYYDAAFNLKPGDTITNGGNVFTAIMFKDAATDWRVMVGDVCFDGMRCGGADDCYAGCDMVMERPNQLCGLSSTASPNDPINKIEPSAAEGTQAGPEKKEAETPGMGETTHWIRDDKKVEIEMSKTEKGIYWRRKGDKDYTYFFKVPGGNYRYETEKVFYLLQFASETRVNFLDNGAIVNYYTLVTTDDEPKTAAEENGSKYFLKGTTVWKWPHSEDNLSFALMDGGLITVLEIGQPYPNIDKMKATYKTVGSDTYQQYYVNKDSLGKDIFFNSCFGFVISSYQRIIIYHGPIIQKIYPGFRYKL